MTEKKILIADDEEGIRNLFVRVLEGEDCRLFLASNGKEAVDIVETSPIDLAILDIKMPEMDGIQALKRIKEIDEAIEVIVVTGHADLDSLREMIMENGAYDYLLKPVNVNAIKPSIGRALEKRKSVLRKTHEREELEKRDVELEEDCKEKTYQLRASQIRYESIIENSNDIIVVVQDGYVKFANKKALELTGFSREEYLSTPFTELIHPEDRAMEEQRDLRRLRGEDIPSVYTFRALRKDGTSMWVEISAVTTTWDERPATLNFLRDVSERMEWEEAMRIKDAALATSINGIAFADLEGNLTYVNQAFLRMWGYRNEKEVLGRPVETFLRSKRSASDAIQALWDKEGWEGELTALRKDASTFYVQVSSSLVRDERGRPVCMMASFRDITEQKQMMEFMRQADKLSSLGQLAAGLAHELRNPLAVISSCSQFCLDNISLERVLRENFQVIYRNSQRAGSLINDLLSFARPEHMEWTEVDVNELLRGMLDMARLGSKSFHCKITTHFRKRLPKIRGDREKLGQVFLNLIQNAVQAVSKKGKITVQSSILASEDMLEVNIIDDGPGISEEYLSRIFDPFFTTKDEGTGLGLSICHTIVEQHKGNITIENLDKAGTKASVRLPVNQD